MSVNKHILVIGAGSVGKRHLQNFSALGCAISAIDPRADRLDEARRTLSLVHAFSDLESALAQAQTFSGVVICSPPNAHVEQAKAALQAGLPIYLEKPVCPTADAAAELVRAADRARVGALLGYTYRWWPPIRDLKARLDQQAVGKLLQVRCTMAAHLADWHPWERYQDFFMSSQAQGGGALLDESHVLDLMLWFFGMPQSVFARVEHVSSLEIETDDHVDALLYYANGFGVYIHLDLYTRPHERAITAVGEQGTLTWSYERNAIAVSHSAGPEWVEERYSCERNEMFMSAAAEFLQVIEEKRSPSCSLADGYAVLRVIEAIRQSSAEGRRVFIE